MSIRAAIIGSGNIGTDLMVKILRRAEHLEAGALVGIDPASDGLALARRLGVEASDSGVEELVRSPVFDEIEVVFDATSAAAHPRNDAVLRAVKPDIRVIDLTPAAIGPYCVPVVNLEDALTGGHRNLNMVTCGGQATIPIVSAVANVAEVHYAEIVAAISSRSAGPGTRANIDEFTETTSKALESLGGAQRGKAIIILNPAEPPMLMRDTIYTLSPLKSDESRIAASIEAMIERVQSYVPGYRLKQAVQFERFDAARPLKIPGVGRVTGLKASIFLEVEGAAHYLPAYAGNLDVMTSAALAAGERAAQQLVAAARSIA